MPYRRAIEYQGHTWTLTELAQIAGLSPQRLNQRLKHFPVAQAVETPVGGFPLERIQCPTCGRFSGSRRVS